MYSLNKNDMVRILQRFADDPEEVQTQKEMIVCRINGKDLTLDLSIDDDGVLYCQEEDGRKEKAKRWIEKNLAHLDDLASKILLAIPDDQCFIPVSSRRELSDGTSSDCFKTTDAIFEDLRKSLFATSAVYLLSEAGDGKTMIMNRLARVVASAYQRGEVHFLFLPIELAGLPFMRFDDLFVGQLAQKFRFRGYYFDGIIELVKLGFITLGLDGFEEIAVEGKDDKVLSSLGELLTQFDSSGKIVVSARRAFYEYALENQQALGEVMRTHDIEISSYRLRQWTGKEFRALLGKYAFTDSEIQNIYERVKNRLGERHPILTRPVLARKLVDYIVDSDDNNVIDNIDRASDPSEVLDRFVMVLLEREAKFKWLSTSGRQTNKQLLKVADHFKILQNLAEEMWLSRKEFVEEGYLKEWMGLVCDELNVGVLNSRDCCNKIVYHAMLKKEGVLFSFCHEAFRMYFLGRQIAEYIVESRYTASLVNILSLEVLPDAVIDEAAHQLACKKVSFTEVCTGLQKLKGGTSKTSPMGQNVGLLLILFKEKAKDSSQCLFKDLYFSGSVMRDVNVSNICFENCVIENLCLSGDKCCDVDFIESTVECVTIMRGTRVKNVVFDATSVPVKLIDETHSEDVYAPGRIRSLLLKIGCNFKVSSKEDDIIVIEEHPQDSQVQNFFKIVRMFSRASFITENIMKMKFGAEWSSVERELVSKLKREGVIEMPPPRQGNVQGFKLRCSMRAILDAERKTPANVDELIRALRVGIPK